MYVNKCIKCGAEFETKNPKRVICPECLYPDRASVSQEGLAAASSAGAASYPRSYSAGTGNEGGYKRFNNNNRENGERRPFNRNNNGGGFQRREGGFQKRPGGGGFHKGGPRRPMRPQNKPKALLINKEQLAQIEELYKKMLPLPNPDAHEIISEKIGLEPKKVFFCINLVRQKMMLPKIAFPKRKLAITPDQLMAIRNLYEPLLPLPPIGCHKILAMQLKMDEWRVHVGIGLVRKQMGLERWNQEREDAPEEYRKQK